MDVNDKEQGIGETLYLQWITISWAFTKHQKEAISGLAPLEVPIGAWTAHW